MLRFMGGADNFRVGLMLAVLSFAACPCLKAKETCPLVVVLNDEDQDTVKRLGKKHVRVEVLLTTASNTETTSYETCNQRVQRLLDFRLLLRCDGPCSVREFWQDRMSAANPNAKVHRLSRARPTTEIESQLQRVNDIHDALVAICPEKQDDLDANLRSEVHRLHSLHKEALRDQVPAPHWVLLR